MVVDFTKALNGNCFCVRPGPPIDPAVRTLKRPGRIGCHAVFIADDAFSPCRKWFACCGEDVLYAAAETDGAMADTIYLFYQTTHHINCVSMIAALTKSRCLNRHPFV